MKVKEVIALIEDDGWRMVRMKGSHRQYKHPMKHGLVTIAGKPGDDLAAGALNSTERRGRNTIKANIEKQRGKQKGDGGINLVQFIF